MKQKTSARVFASLAVAGALLGVAGKANASGNALIEQSVKQNGSAISGGAASAEDATTIYFNPAGMTRLHGRQVAVGGYLIATTKSSFSGRATTNPTLPIGGGSAIEGSNASDPDSFFYIPSFYYMHELNERMRVGLGIGVLFGNSMEHDSGWMGRYHTIKPSLSTLNFNPSIAYKINDKLSLGAGISIMRAEIEYISALDYSAACLASSDSLGLICSALGLNTPGDPRTDGKVVISAEDWGFGFNFGLLYELSEEMRIGFAYRSHIKMKLEGTADFTKPEPDILGIIPFVPPQMEAILKDTDVLSVMDLPDSLSLSLTAQVAPKWDLMTDVTWTKWSKYEARVKYNNPLKADYVVSHNYEDTYRVSLGFNYHYNTKWNWRGGIAYDKTPAPDTDHRTPRIPGSDRIWLAGGLTYRVSPAMTVDFALAHIFMAETEIDNPDPHFGHILSGTYDADTNIISSQVNWQF